MPEAGAGLVAATGQGAPARYFEVTQPISLVEDDIELMALHVNCETLRGQRLSFGWEGPLLMNGEERPLSGYKHYDSPYCVAEMGATKMDIQYGDYTMRLSFEG